MIKNIRKNRSKYIKNNTNPELCKNCKMWDSFYKLCIVEDEACVKEED